MDEFFRWKYFLPLVFAACTNVKTVGDYRGPQIRPTWVGHSIEELTNAMGSPTSKLVNKDGTLTYTFDSIRYQRDVVQAENLWRNDNRSGPMQESTMDVQCKYTIRTSSEGKILSVDEPANPVCNR
jgi:hypothetical protein